MSYLTWKLIHIVGVVMFLGNITTGLFWAAYAHRQKNLELTSITFQGIIKSDRWFTLPGVFGILAGGFGAAIHSSIPVFRTGWIFWPIVLFSISGIIFGLTVAPLQKKIRQFASTNPQTEENWRVYCRLYRRWEIWGLLAWVTPVLAMVIMVLKLPVRGILN